VKQSRLEAGGGEAGGGEAGGGEAGGGEGGGGKLYIALLLARATILSTHPLSSAFPLTIGMIAKTRQAMIVKVKDRMFNGDGSYSGGFYTEYFIIYIYKYIYINETM
jgi:hypothetical protein